MPTWKYLLKSLFSNQTIIDGRKRPFYWALMFFILSIFMMCVVPLAKGYQNDGTSIVNPTSDQGVSMGLYNLSRMKEFKNLYIEDGVLKDSSEQIGDSSNFTDINPVYPDYFFASTNLDTATLGTINGNVRVEATEPANPDYVTNLTISTDTGSPYSVPVLRVFSSSLSGDALTDQINRQIFRSDIPDESIRPINRSFMVFTPTEYFIYVYPPLPTSSDNDTDALASSSTTGTVFHGVFSRFQERFDFKDLAVEGAYSYEKKKDDNEFLQKWAPFITESYKPVRNASIWKQLGITAGATAGAIILCGIVIWLFTLGRRNLIHRDCNAWEGIKMSATLSFTVSVIGMVAYFFSPVYSWMFGAMGLILRTMWLIMKTNGGRTQDQGKPLYQAR